MSEQKEVNYIGDGNYLDIEGDGTFSMLINTWTDQEIRLDEIVLERLYKRLQKHYEGES